MPAPDTLQPAQPRAVGSQPPAMFGQFRTACGFALRNQARNRLAGPLLVVFVPACPERGESQCVSGGARCARPIRTARNYSNLPGFRGTDADVLRQ